MVKKIVIAGVLFLIGVPLLQAGALPNIEAPNTAKSRLVIKALETIQGNISKALNEGTADNAAATNAQKVCGDVREDLRRKALKGEYNPQVGTEGWQKCSEAYQAV